MTRKENWKKTTERKDQQVTRLCSGLRLGKIFSKRYPQATPQAMLQAKYLPSGYARGNASGKFFIICENFRPQATPQATLQAIFKKYLPSGHAPGYASGKLKKYLPSGYARGYASGKISATPQATLQANLKNIYPHGTLGATPPAKFFVIFEEIAPGHALRSALPYG
ncbi:hypothetical protein T09_126 [Trichinella sp. T9]|nr:hypothetical protein T09_126 [Trichinella sp. T9]